MKEHNPNIGLELLALLRRQRYLYHQLRLLTDRQRQCAGTNSPKLLLQIIFGRRRLVEKLRDVNNKLRPVKADWPRLSRQITPESHTQARDIANQVRQIVAEIAATAPPEVSRNLPLGDGHVFGELFIESQSK
ncbi:MAG: hypothetical protein ACYS4W_12485 [Planctomycetota bacterium]|jgi:hypothetical protein